MAEGFTVTKEKRENILNEKKIREIDKWGKLRVLNRLTLALFQWKRKIQNNCLENHTNITITMTR